MHHALHDKTSLLASVPPLCLVAYRMDHLSRQKYFIKIKFTQ